jgi:hypothetical protein
MAENYLSATRNPACGSRSVIPFSQVSVTLLACTEAACSDAFLAATPQGEPLAQL